MRLLIFLLVLSFVGCIFANSTESKIFETAGCRTFIYKKLVDESLFKVEKVYTESDFRKSFENFLSAELKRVFPNSKPEDFGNVTKLMAHFDLRSPELLEVPEQADIEVRRAIICWNYWQKPAGQNENSRKSLRESWKSPWFAVIFGHWNKLNDKDQYQRVAELASANRDKPELMRFLWRLCMPLNKANLMQMFDALPADKKVDPWLDAITRGLGERNLAWKSRGNSWGHKVSKEGWKGFDEHMNLSDASFAKAYELYPDRPEAAAWMAGNRAARSSGEEAYHWLKKAVEAQVDFYPAFGQIYWFRRSRWGGSPRELKDLGELCLRADIPGSDLGFIGIRGLIFATWDMDNYIASFAFTPENLPLARKAMDEADHYGRYSADELALLRASVEFSFGCYPEAFAAFKKFGPENYIKKRYSLLDHKSSFRWINLTTSQKAMEGKYGTFFMEIEREINAEKREDAAAKLEEFLKNPEVKDFDRDYAATTYGYIKGNFAPFYYNLAYSPIILLTISRFGGDNNLPIIAKVLEMGADPNAYTGNIPEPLLHSMVRETGHAGAIKLLLKAGADPTVRNRDGETALELAIRLKRTKAIEALSESK